MPDEEKVGWFVSRGDRGARPIHLVVTEVGGDTMTRCGKRMRPRNADGVELAFVPKTAVVSSVLKCRGGCF